MTTVTGTIAQAGESVTLDARLANAAVIHIKGGTVNATGLNVSFEGSVDDGQTWFPIQAARTNANTVETASGALAVNAGVGVGYAWRINAATLTHIRVRPTAITAGNVVVTIKGNRYPIEPAPVVQAHAVTQSGTWTVTASPANGTGYSVETTAGTNLAVVTNAAANLKEITVSNPSASAAYVKLYNKATNATLASDTPLMTIPVPAGAIVALEFGREGKRFATGIAIAVTGAMAKTDTTNAPAGVQISATRV